MSTAAATYDHATAVADILAGYYRTEMALRRDDTSSLELKHLQDGRARPGGTLRAARPSSPRRSGRTASRADKAAYLRDKLADAEQADRAAGADPARPS